MKPILIAHRCGPDIYPEQSIASARHALSLGADLVEMDVQLTCDGELVICHDPNTARIFGVDKLCREMTFIEFMALRHCADRSYPSHSVEDVLSTELRPILFHCKISGEPLKMLAATIAAHGMTRECVIGVQSVGDVGIVKSVCDEIRVLAFMPKIEMMEEFLATRCEYIRLWEDWTADALVNRIHSTGKQVWIMACRQEQGGVGYTTQESMNTWMDMGVDGILVNDVRWAKKIMN